MSLLHLKHLALEKKHRLEHLAAIYDAFQEYAQSLVPYMNGTQDETSLIVHFERFRLLFNEYEHAFLEMREGESFINDGIAAFLNASPDEFKGSEPYFRTNLLLATTKFQDLLGKAGRDLREYHEKITLEEGATKAEEITKVPISAMVN
jgi:hypothetical protein